MGGFRLLPGPESRPGPAGGKSGRQTGLREEPSVCLAPAQGTRGIEGTAYVNRAAPPRSLSPAPPPGDTAPIGVGPFRPFEQEPLSLFFSGPHLRTCLESKGERGSDKEEHLDEP